MSFASCTRSNGRFTGGSPNDMKPQDDPDKANRSVPGAQREKLLGQMIEVMEYLYDGLDSGKSFEEIEIMTDISAAGGRTSEDLREWCHLALGIIRSAREQGAGRNEVMTYMRRIAKELCEITERDGWR